MKDTFSTKTLRALLCGSVLTIALLPAVSCGNGREADNSAATKSGTEKELLCGGYTDLRKITAEEMKMFRSLTGKGALTLTPLYVATQVVAGTNYKFWCKYEDKTQNQTGNCWVVIYQPLQGDPELSEIKR